MCLKINTLLGIGLKVDPPSFFTEAHLRSKGTSGTTLRYLYYPPLSSFKSATSDTEIPTPLDVRAGAHSDYGSITMLFRLRGQAGLEIQTRSGEWAPVPVTPPGTENDPAPPILVNIGDLLSYWTNGLLRSTVHRVVFSSEQSVPGETNTDPRYSIAYFCHPVGSMPLTPVPSERVRAFRRGDADVGGGGGGEGEEKETSADGKVLTANEHLISRYEFIFSISIFCSYPHHPQ